MHLNKTLKNTLIHNSIMLDNGPILSQSRDISPQNMIAKSFIINIALLLTSSLQPPVVKDKIIAYVQNKLKYCTADDLLNEWYW